MISSTYIDMIVKKWQNERIFKVDILSQQFCEVENTRDRAERTEIFINVTYIYL